ncbi:right-handed parallel beta-helix repeat-containing protein [Vibrio sp. RC27]
MCYFKSFIGSKAFIASLVFTILLFSWPHRDAEACSIYVTNGVSSVDSDEEPAEDDLFFDIEKALQNSVSGDTICFKQGIYSAFGISDIDGGSDYITIRSVPGEEVVILSHNYSGTGVAIKNSKNIVVSGLKITGGLYGIYSTGSSDMTFTGNNIYDIGQEGIVIKSEISQQPLSNFVVRNNVISNIGKKNSQYGEGIYLGDGRDNYNEELYDIEVVGNHIFNSGNEAIDVKINAKNVLIKSNTITDTQLHFNGAITVATAARYGEDSNVRIEHNNISGVTNINGYRANGIAVGHGNVVIKDNVLIEKSDNFIGVCVYTTFVNRNANTVTVENNNIITSGDKVVEKCANGGMENMNEAANVVYN